MADTATGIAQQRRSGAHTRPTPQLSASLCGQECCSQWPSKLGASALQEYQAQARAAQKAARARAAEAASRANETPMPTAAGQRRFRQEMPALLNDHERPGLVSRFTHTGPEFVETRGDVEVGKQSLSLYCLAETSALACLSASWMLNFRGLRLQPTPWGTLTAASSWF